MSSPRPQRSTRALYALGLGCELGILIALPLILCVLVGVGIDRKFNTFPWGLLIAVVLGIALTVVDVYKIVLPFLEKRSSKGNNINNNQQ